MVMVDVDEHGNSVPVGELIIKAILEKLDANGSRRISIEDTKEALRGFGPQLPWNRLSHDAKFYESRGGDITDHDLGCVSSYARKYGYRLMPKQWLSKRT